MAYRLPSRRDVVLTGLATGLAPGLVRAQPAPTSDMAFLVLGDWGSGGGSTQKAVAKAMKTEAARISSQVVLTVGDNFYNRGINIPYDPKTGKDDPHWQKSFVGVYGDGFGDWYPSLGNHDHDGKPELQFAYADRNTRWKMRKNVDLHRLSTSAGKTVHLIQLDTSPIADPGKYERTEDELKALNRDTLAALRAPADWKFVFGHHPLYSSGGRTDREPARVLMRAWLKPLLLEHGCDAYFCGHDHHLEHLVDTSGGAGNDMPHVLSGGGGGSQLVTMREKPVDESVAGWSTGGFAACQISGDTLTVRYIDKKGKDLREAAGRTPLTIARRKKPALVPA